MATSPLTEEDKYIDDVVHQMRDSRKIMGVIALLIIAAVIGFIAYGIIAAPSTVYVAP